MAAGAVTRGCLCQITDKSDYGEYVCVASNARGSDAGSVHLNGQ